MSVSSLCPFNCSLLQTDDIRPHVIALCSRAERKHEWSASMKECYLVDPASSHMLVSKIKPCMCKYELIQTVKLRMAH